MNLFDDTTHQILMKFLDKKVEDAEKEIAVKGTLSEEHAIPLILKTLFNHVAHLDAAIIELGKSFDELRNSVDAKISGLSRQVNVGLTLGFSIIAFLIILFGFLK